LTTIRNVQGNAQFRPSKFLHPDFAVIVERSPKLKQKLVNFFSAFKTMTQIEKDSFYDRVTRSQDIEQFFSDMTIICSDTQTVAIRQLLGNDSFSALVKHLFTITLKTLDIESHYRAIYDSMPYKVCPFCGVEKMHQTFQEDYDHLAAKRHYPLAAVNMKNLAPMCHTCNSKNKGEKDVLHNADGTRKLFIYPYTHSYNVTLDFSNCIIPQTDINNIAGSWDVLLDPDDDITRSWDYIFNIRKRYRDDYFNASYEDWLEDFLDGLKMSNIVISNSEEMIAHLSAWSQTLNTRKFYNLNFIKAPLFDFLANCGIAAFYSALVTRYQQKLAA
jgi:hypothetical protein